MAEDASRNFYVMYMFSVIPDKELQFIEAWGKLTAEVRLRYESFGCNLHMVDGSFMAYAQWPDEKSWKTFWEGREQEVQALPQLRECLSKESEVTVIPVMSSSLSSTASQYKAFS